MQDYHFNKRSRLRYPKLMIPGPVEVSQAVLKAIGSQAVPDYGDDWVELFKETTDALKKTFNTKGDVFLLVSSGTGGMECAINSLFAPDEKIIVVSNGFFGERMVAVATNCGLDVVPVSMAWGSVIDPDYILRTLKKEGNVAGIVSVHHETSTGILNPIKDIARIAQDFGIPIVVDAISTLGGEEFDMDGWGIDICVTTSNKCLQALPGLSPIAVNNNAWEIINRKKSRSHGWYLNLSTWKQYSEEWSNWHPYPITMAVNTVLALNVALEELFAEGLSNRISRYQSVAYYCRERLREQGLSMFVDGTYASSTISAVNRPVNHDIQLLINYLQDNFNIRIAGGLGQTKGSIFRIGHMGQAASKEYVDTLIYGIKEFLIL